MGWLLWVGVGRQIAAGNEEVDEMDQELVVGGYEESAMKKEVNDVSFAMLTYCIAYKGALNQIFHKTEIILSPNYCLAQSLSWRSYQHFMTYIHTLCCFTCVLFPTHPRSTYPININVRTWNSVSSVDFNTSNHPLQATYTPPS